MRRLPVRSLTSLLLLSGPAAACGGPNQPGAGPLSVGGVQGGFAFREPRARPERWWGSQGGFALCTTGAPLEIRGVRADPRSGVVLDLEAWVVSDVPRRSLDGSFGTTLGRPPRFNQPYVEGEALRGDYRRAEGVEVADECPAASLKGDGSELVIAVRADRRGVDLPDFTIDYVSEGEPYSLDVGWATILCGTEVRRRCDGR